MSVEAACKQGRMHLELSFEKSAQKPKITSRKHSWYVPEAVDHKRNKKLTLRIEIDPEFKDSWKKAKLEVLSNKRGLHYDVGNFINYM